MSLQTLFPSIDGPIDAPVGVISPNDDFEVLHLALDAAGLTDTVAGLSNFTLFAPTDAAFAGLAQGLGYEGDPDDATGVFNAIAGALGGLAEDGDPIPLLTDILQYHVSPEQTDLETLNSGGPVTTLLDGATFEVTGGTVVDGDTDYENAGIVAPDLEVPGGTVQIVDQILLPIDTPAETAGDPTLLGILEESGGSFDTNTEDFDLLLTALQATGLDEAVDDPEADLTVFVPNDAAFISLAQDLGYEGDDEAGAFQTIVDAATELNPDDPLSVVTDILLYHVSPGEQDADDVLGSESLQTLLGPELGVEGTSLVDQDPNATDPGIVATNIEASNGIAHVIDGVLRPVDLPPEADPEDPVVEEDDDDGFLDILLGLGLIGLVVGAFAGVG